MEKCFDRITQMDKRYDVIVVGGGTAGSAAAITAARSGADTLLIERSTYLGGTCTGGQVTPMMHNGIASNRDTALNRELKSHLAAEGYSGDDHCGNNGWLNPEMMKFELEDLFISAGGNLLYDTEFLDAIVEQKRITGILVHNRCGILRIEAKEFIDCTGDAELAFSSGVPCRAGDESTHQNQSVSLRFMMGNVNILKLDVFLKQIGEEGVLELPFFEMCCTQQDNTPLSALFQKGVADGMLEPEDTAYFQAFSVPGMPGTLSFNCPEISGPVDCLNAEQTSLALVIGRRMIRRLVRFFQTCLPGFEESFISSVSPMLGIRESRRITGLYTLTDLDYSSRSKFPDAIAQTAYPIDIHSVGGQLCKIKPMARGEYMEIPFRCLVPQSIENLLVAGRCISSSFAAQSAIRIQPTCRATGEAAGLAAVYGAAKRIPIQKVDGRQVRDAMKKIIDFKKN